MPAKNQKETPPIHVRPIFAREKMIEAMFGIPAGTLQQWRAAGVGPRYSKLGRVVVYRVSEVEEWLECNLEEPLPPGSGDRRSGFKGIQPTPEKKAASGGAS